MIGFSIQTIAQQHTYWQQVDYTMTIDVDTETHRLKGTQQLVLQSFSRCIRPSVLSLYFNAFQPGSMMDVRSRTTKIPMDALETELLFK